MNGYVFILCLNDQRNITLGFVEDSSYLFLWMPYLTSKNYNETPFMLLNGHLETIIPPLFHIAPMVKRQRLEFKDGDLIDLDWLLKNNYDRLLIITYGLEGNS